MADNKIDIQINADVQGRESVADLATRLEGLAAVLDGEVKTRALEAAAQLRELARQDDAINQFGQLKAAASESARALKSAETEAANFAKQIAAAGPPTATEAAALQTLQEASDAIHASMAQQQEALGGATAELQGFGVSAASAEQAQQRLREQMDQVRESVKSIIPEYDGAKTGASGLQQAMTALGVVSDESLMKTAEVARVAYETLKAAGTASTRELQAAFKEYAERAIVANGGVVTEAMRIEAALRGVQIQTDSAGRAIVTSMGAAEEATGGFLESMRGKLTAVAAAVASYFTVDFFVGAVSGAGDLEQALDRVQSATNGTAQEMALLRKAAEESGVDSIAAAGALENLAKAGLDAKDAIGALPAVISLAKSGDVEMAESAEFLTKAVMGMGLKFSEAARVADVLAAGANATNTSVKGLAEGLSYAAPVAQGLGLSLETTVAIIGKFADAGIDASRAGTALNSVLSQFGDPASKFRGELAAAGITTGNFEKALHELAAAGPRGAKAINAVGMEAGPALRALLNQGMPALDELIKKLGSAEGAAAAAAAVMDGNMNGALASLSVAWKYVKDTLGTPVLPVITSAVNDLTAALRGAVQDGTVGKFGEALAAGFQSGIKWAKDFLAQINFTQVSADLRVFADRAGEVFVQIGEYANTAGNTVKLVYGVMSSGTNAVLGSVYLVGESFALVASKIQSGLALMEAGFAKVTLGKLREDYAAAAADMQLSAEATMAASVELGAKSDAAFGKVAESAQLARDGFAGLSAAATGAAPAVSASAQVVGDMAKQLTAAAEKTAAAQQATTDKKAADEAAAVALRQLREEYKALVDKGDVQGAAEKLLEINKALQATPPAAKDAIKAAQEAAQAIADAFQRLGVTSSADLKLQADNAMRDYQIIKGAGTSTASDIASAFKKAAEDAIVANNGIAPSWVAAEAAANGYQVKVDGTGKTTVTAMQDAAKAIKTVEDAYRQLGLKTPEELNKVAEANKAAWDKIKGESSTGAATLKAAFQAYSEAALAAAGDVGSEQRLVTQEVLTTEAAAKGLTVTFDATGKAIVTSMGEGRDAVRGHGDQVDGLARSYRGVGDAAESASERAVSALERQNAAIERANAAAEKAVELENKRLNRDKEGFSTGKDGQRIVAGTDIGTLTGIAAFLKAAGVDDDKAARKLALEFSDGQGNIDYIGNAGQKKYGGDTLSMALLKAAETYTFGADKNGSNAKTPSTIPAPAAPAATYITNITLPSGGGIKPVRMLDADSQSVVNDLVRQLALARGTAS